MTCCGGEAGEKDRPWWPILAAIALAGNSMVLALAVNLSEVRAHERMALHAVLAAATLAVLGLVGAPFFRALTAALGAGKISIEALFLCGILGAAGLSGRAILRHEGDVYLEVISVLLAVHALGQRLKVGQQTALRRELDRLGRFSGDCVRVDDLRGAGARRGRCRDVRVGDLLRLDADALAPVDGRVVAGRGTFDLSMLTGEPMGAARGPGAALPAGARCLDGWVIVEAAATEATGTLAHLRAAIDAALARRSRIEVRAERGLVPLTLAVLGVAAATAAFWGWREGAGPAFLHGMAVLLVACPCALGFATPVGMWTAVVRLAQRGVVVRSTAAIERLAGVGVVALDKTGTLTELAVADAGLLMVSTSPVPRGPLLAMVRAAQAGSSHPIARALERLEPDPSHAPGGGWHLAGPAGTARAGSLVVQLAAGAARRAVAFHAPSSLPAGRPPPELDALLARCPQGVWPLVITIDGQPSAVVMLGERLVPAARRAAAELRRLGLAVVMLSGDAGARTDVAATALAIPAEGGLSPVDKQRAVERLKAAHGGGLCLVGDGINDVAAMASSEVGVAVAEAAGLAVAAADLTLPSGGLGELGPSIQICRQTLRSVRASLAISGCYNLAGMAAAAAGLLHPAWAALLMVVASGTVTWRSSRLLHASSGSRGRAAFEPHAETSAATT